MSISRLIERIDEARERHDQIKSEARGQQLLSMLIAFVFVLALYPSKAHAQVVGNLEVNIPFPFYVGDAKLPPGEYGIHVRDDTDVRIMEIASADGTISALFDAKDAVANSTPPKSELIFNKYGDRYFLAELFDEGNRTGSRLGESRYEEKAREAAAEAQGPAQQERVPAHHQAAQGRS